MSGFLQRRPSLRLPTRAVSTGARRARDRTAALERRVVELEQERQDLARILDSLGEGVLAVDRAGVVVHANPAAFEMLGLDPEACVGSHMYVAVPQREAWAALDRVMRGEPAVLRELAGEGDRVLVADVRPMRPGDGPAVEPEGALAVVRDVTELRRLERSRRDFFGNVSHELKTPVTAVRGAIETILDDPGIDAAARDRFLDAARRHVLRLGTLVSDLLALARLEGDPTALAVEEVDVASVVGEVLAAAEAQAARRDVALQMQVEPVEQLAACTMQGDEEALRQALTNLVDNAVSHSDPGGEVRVTISPAATDLRIDVRDDGPGIPPHALERVFERFYRVDAARSRARGGTGIGLSIVKHVAQAHGGSVSARSTVGAGSTFTLRLPVSHAHPRGTDSAQ